MSTPNEDEDPRTVAERAKKLKRYLQAMKDDYQTTLKSAEKQAKSKTDNSRARAQQDDLVNEQNRQDAIYELEKINLIQAAIEKINTSSEEAETIILFGTYLQQVDAQMATLKRELRITMKDKAELEAENKTKTKKLKAVEEELMLVKDERDHFKFMYELHKEQGGIADTELL